MKVAFGVALSAALLFQQAPPREASVARTAAAAAIDAAGDPSDCVTALKAFAARRRQEIRPPSGLTPQLLAQVDAETAALGDRCVSRFSDSSNPAVLPGMAALYVEMGRLDNARSSAAAALSANLPPERRAAALAAAIAIALHEPKGEARYAKIETLLDELDKNPSATLDQRWSVHARLEGEYRSGDVDAGIVKHARWLAAAAGSLTPEQRRTYGPDVVTSHVNMAEALAGQGMNDEALAVLRKAAANWNEVPGAGAYITPAIARYSLVGSDAPPIKAPTWLNAPAGVKEMPMRGAVTLVEFTAHWCGPCRKSYPGVNRLRAQFESKGFRVVMVTRYWGYFSSPDGMQRDISPEEERKQDAAYFAEYHLDVPVAIGDYASGPDPNDSAYKVNAIPQIHLIDRKGRIRLIMVGYDDANEPKLADLIAKLLAES